MLRFRADSSVDRLSERSLEVNFLMTSAGTTVLGLDSRANTLIFLSSFESPFTMGWFNALSISVNGFSPNLVSMIFR